MTPEKMKELLFSLAWYDCSCHHHNNVRAILADEFPNIDFDESLKEFTKCVTMAPGKGCPR
jgi:hypothetical protein